MNVARKICQLAAGWTLLGAVAAAPPADGDLGRDATRMDEVVVFGRAVDLVGTATAASQGSVGYLELDARPFLRRGELLEVIPGVVITQHSGGGKANQYFLRGFNLDHGTDFSITADGMPVNLRSHAHGQGYADLNFIIPEFVEGIDYVKGPFSAAVGDFSAAGAANFHLFATLPQAFVKLEAGAYNFQRLVAGDSLAGSGGVTTLGFEYTHADGPWVLPEDLRRESALARHTWQAGPEQEFSLTALAYHAEWRSTDQVPLRAVKAGVISRFGNIDPTDGGETERYSLSGDWQRRGPDSTTRLNVYALYYRLSLYSDFTYFLDDPVHGDQFNQRDRRGVFGANLAQANGFAWFGRRWETTVGIQLRDDAIGQLDLDHTAQREVVGPIRHDVVQEASAALYAEGVLHWSPWLRFTAGARGDGYFFHDDSDNPLNSGRRTAAIFSPKAGLVLGPWARTELYFNAGLGFHSNDARGTTIRVSPTDGSPVDRDSPLVRSRGLEAGVRTSALPGLVSTVSIWFLDLDSELVFSGDAGDTEASGATRRYGIEWGNYYRLRPWAILDADLALTQARYRHSPGADHVANSIGTVVTAGLTLGQPAGWFGAARLRFFGRQPIVEDDSAEEPASTTLNLRTGWRNRQWEVAADVLNALDRRDDDIAYYYTSRLPGEPAAGVADTHFHPAEPRELRVSVTRRF